MPRITVIVPTLGADDALFECLASLERQTFRDFETIVVDNSGERRVARTNPARFVRIIESPGNVGFGAAINAGWRDSKAPFIAVLNDDAVADTDWLASLYNAAEKNGEVGMWASCVRLSPSALDSAGMLLHADGSSKQRGHRQSPERYQDLEEVLLPSGSAAMYRRSMLEKLGGFDEDFFLYCEDTDLGLRAQWTGWKCLFVPGAIVDHRYSHSAGRVSPLKAYFVERNRLFVALKCFPLSMLMAAPFHSVARYLWHALTLVSGHGPAGEFRKSGQNAALLPIFVLRAHLVALSRLPGLWRKRRQLMSARKIRIGEFRELVRRHAISSHEVASL